MNKKLREKLLLSDSTESSYYVFLCFETVDWSHNVDNRARLWDCQAWGYSIQNCPHEKIIENVEGGANYLKFIANEATWLQLHSL
jgi:hypothetical protein